MNGNYYGERKKIKFPYIKFNKIQNTRAVSAAQDRSHKIFKTSSNKQAAVDNDENWER